MLDTSDMQDSATTDTTAPASIASQPASRKKIRKVLRFVLWSFAALGMFFVGLIGYLTFRGGFHPYAIDETSATDAIMEGAYGKYSESAKGWYYATDTGTYLVSIVQQKKITEDDVDTLYLVTSGELVAEKEPDATPSDERHLFGVFKVTSDKNVLSQVSQPYTFFEGEPLKPEQVRFEAFSVQHWGWVVKTQYADEQTDELHTLNSFLVPDDDKVYTVARFVSAADNTVDNLLNGDTCAAANAKHAAWEARTTAQENDPELEKAAHEGIDPVDEPPRCTRLNISYRTEPVDSRLFTPLLLKYSGMKDGQKVPEKSWKVLYDERSHSYRLPKEVDDLIE